MGQDKNIFETAAKRLRKEKEATKETDKESRKPSKAPSTEAQYRDPRLKEIMLQIKSLNDDLRAKIESVIKKTGISYDELAEMIGKSKIFTPEERRIMEENKHLLSSKVWGTLGVEVKPPGQAAAPAVKQRADKTADRKAKTLGARKKWIPVR